MLLMTPECSQSDQVSLTAQKCPVDLQNYLGWNRLFPSPCSGPRTRLMCKLYLGEWGKQVMQKKQHFNTFCCLCGSYNILTRRKLTMSKYQFLIELYKFSGVKFFKCTVWGTGPWANPGSKCVRHKPSLVTHRWKTDSFLPVKPIKTCRPEPTGASKHHCN